QERSPDRNAPHGERGLRHRADRLRQLPGHRRRRAEHVRRQHRRVRRAPEPGPDGAAPGHVPRRRKRRRSVGIRNRADDGRRLPERIHVVCRVPGHRRRRAERPGRRAGRVRRTAVGGPELDADHDHDDYHLVDHDHPPDDHDDLVHHHDDDAADDHDHFVFDHDDPANDHNDQHLHFDDHYSAGYHHDEHVVVDHDHPADDHHDEYHAPDDHDHHVV